MFPIMKNKFISNCAKVIVKSLCNFFIFENQVSIFIQNNISTSLVVFVRKIRFTIYPKRFAVSRVIRTEIFKLSFFIQFNNIIALFFKITISIGFSVLLALLLSLNLLIIALSNSLFTWGL